MHMMEVEKKIDLDQLFDSQAFHRADEAWPFESWDDKQWERVIKAAKKELDIPSEV